MKRIILIILAIILCLAAFSGCNKSLENYAFFSSYMLNSQDRNDPNDDIIEEMLLPNEALFAYAITKTETDTLLSSKANTSALESYVNTTSAQEIGGIKTFHQQIKANDGVSLKKGTGIRFTIQNDNEIMLYGEGGKDFVYSQIYNKADNKYTWYPFMDLSGNLYSAKNKVATETYVDTAVANAGGGSKLYMHTVRIALRSWDDGDQDSSLLFTYMNSSNSTPTILSSLKTELDKIWADNIYNRYIPAMYIIYDGSEDQYWWCHFSMTEDFINVYKNGSYEYGPNEVEVVPMRITHTVKEM